MFRFKFAQSSVALVAIGFVAACSGDKTEAARSNFSLRLYDSADRTEVEKDCADVQSLEKNGETFYYCANASATCANPRTVCQAIYTEGADPNSDCFSVCEDHAVSVDDCGGTVSVGVRPDGTTTDETYTDGVEACLPTDVPGGTSSGCRQADPNCTALESTPGGTCEDAHVEGVCGKGEAVASCCGMEIPA